MPHCHRGGGGVDDLDYSVKAHILIQNCFLGDTFDGFFWWIPRVSGISETTIWQPY